MSAKVLNEKETSKKKKPNAFIICLSICILAVGMGLIFYFSITLDSYKPTETKEVILAPVEPYINEVACIDWIFRHSSKISKDMATNIFKTAMSTDHGLLLLALAKRESSLNPSAISKKGAIGLNQIMPGVWVEELKKNKIIKEKRDLFNYKANLKASHYILLKYYKETGSWEKALKKYVGANLESYVEDVLANCGELYLLSRNK